MTDQESVNEFAIRQMRDLISNIEAGAVRVIEINLESNPEPSFTDDGNLYFKEPTAFTIAYKWQRYDLSKGWCS